MTIFYVDFVNGNDANTGTAWGAGSAWATLTNGPTAARTTATDEVRVAKSPDPYSLGTGKWTQTPLSAAVATKGIRSSTAASPIVITTTAAHNLSSGDVVRIYNHTTNIKANGTWIISVTGATTFQLVDDGTGTTSSGVGYSAGGATGTVAPMNPRVVLLDTATTKRILDGDVNATAWTAANGASTAWTANSTLTKYGNGFTVTTPPSSTSPDTKYAYFAFSAVNLSAYDSITFWFKQSSSIARLANNWKICLCSDALGATPVNTFIVPANPVATTNWIPYTISGGGALGASIQSIAIYSSTAAPTGGASGAVAVCNVSACSFTGLNMLSLISKNSSAKGGSEPWYAIQGISGKIVALESYWTDSPLASGGWYWGASESVTTYARETIKLPAASTTTAALQTMSNPNTFSGGWNPNTGAQDGETFLDAITGFGTVLYQINHATVGNISYLSGVRGTYGMWLYSNSFPIRYSSVSNCRFIGNQIYGLYLNYVIDSLFDQIQCLGGQLYTGGSAGNCLFTNGLFINASTCIFVGNSNNLRFYNCIIAGGSSYYAVDIRYSSNVGWINSLFYGNFVYTFTVQMCEPYLYNCLLASPVECVPLPTAGRLSSANHDQSPGAARVFLYGGQANLQAATRPGSTGNDWLISVASASADSTSPARLPIGKVAFVANKLVTVSCYLSKSHATNVAAALVCPGLQVAGVSGTVSTNAPSDTNWNKVTITFLPTESGVAQIEAWAWYVAATGTVTINTVEISQAA